MTNGMECPFCCGFASLQKQERELLYRKENFQVVEYYYKCDTFREEFTTTESDTLTMKQVYTQHYNKRDDTVMY